MGVDCLLHSSGQEAEKASYPPENTKRDFFFPLVPLGQGTFTGLPHPPALKSLFLDPNKANNKSPEYDSGDPAAPGGAGTEGQGSLSKAAGGVRPALSFPEGVPWRKKTCAERASRLSAPAAKARVPSRLAASRAALRSSSSTTAW